MHVHPWVKIINVKKFLSRSLPASGQNRLWILKLNAFNLKLLVPNAMMTHAPLSKPRLRASTASSRSMISEWYRVAVKGLGKSGKNGLPVVVNRGSFAVHNRWAP